MRCVCVYFFGRLGGKSHQSLHDVSCQMRVREREKVKEIRERERLEIEKDLREKNAQINTNSV